jgi:uroporphyrinogen decarboxylase
VKKRERLEKVLGGGKPDRVPVALWRHFPVDDQTPAGLAQATLAFQAQFDFDLIKVTPASSFCLKDWGAEDEWRGAAEGTRDYTLRVVKDPDDWTRLPILDPHRGFLGEQLDCLAYLSQELSQGADRAPFIQTIFSPLAQAKNLVGGEKLLVHLRQAPDQLHHGLRTITESTLRFLEASISKGIAGIFYAVQQASYALLSEAEFREFGRRYDLEILQAAQSLWLNMLHVHGEHIMFDLCAAYPVHVINWHDRETPPSLAQARLRFSGTLCGGLQRQATMVLGDPDTVGAEALDALQATNGERFILGTGCVLPIIAPSANIFAARQVVER